MKSLSVTNHVQNINDIKLDWIDKPIPTINEVECLIKVVSSGINPSDALATMGYFSHAKLPRVPGRDFAGIIVDGPQALIGQQVWGTGGAAGISFDGTQAEYIKLSVTEISISPHHLDLITAGAQTLPYVTAYYSLVKRALIQAGETVVVLGALGQTGRAAMSICEWKKCKAIALVRGEEAIAEATQLGWQVVDSEAESLAEKILAANNGHTVQVILNSVGNIYWQEYIKILSDFGRIVTIGARENVREVTINLFNLYRANQDIIGINSVALDFKQNAKLLDELRIGFEENKLMPLAVDPSMLYSPSQAAQAYQHVASGTSRKRVVLKFV